MRGIIIVATLLVACPASAQEGWQFSPAGPGHLFGPSFWVEGDTASLGVECFRFSQDILPNPDGALLSPELKPRRLEVAVIWLGRKSKPAVSDTIVGTTLDPRSRTPSTISFRIDDSRIKQKKWETRFGYQQILRADEAVAFLRHLLPPAKRLTVFAEFTDSGPRSETFNLTGIDKLLGRMKSKCAAVGPLLDGHGESR